MAGITTLITHEVITLTLVSGPRTRPGSTDTKCGIKTSSQSPHIYAASCPASQCHTAPALSHVTSTQRLITQSYCQWNCFLFTWTIAIMHCYHRQILDNSLIRGCGNQVTARLTFFWASQKAGFAWEARHWPYIENTEPVTSNAWSLLWSQVTEVAGENTGRGTKVQIQTLIMTTSCILGIQRQWSVNLHLALNLKTLLFLLSQSNNGLMLSTSGINLTFQDTSLQHILTGLHFMIFPEHEVEFHWISCPSKH